MAPFVSKLTPAAISPPKADETSDWELVQVCSSLFPLKAKVVHFFSKEPYNDLAKQEWAASKDDRVSAIATVEEKLRLAGEQLCTRMGGRVRKQSMELSQINGGAEGGAHCA